MSGPDFFDAGVAAFSAIFAGINNLGWITYFMYFGLFIGVVFLVFEITTGASDED